MSNSSRRTNRVAALIRSELAELFLVGTNDPRFSEITITDVEVSADLQNARIGIIGRDGTDIDILKGLKNAEPFFRRELARRAKNLRYIPKLQFYSMGEHLDTVTRLMNTLNEIKKETHSV